ncbi:HAD-IIIC family phosphatase [Spirillospora albida]|uniref:HAD-IIIC family phosphatase n=1 Tax=Spirillospora albida TaxID=58123 RepID=UPI0004C05366|nr:HAD-IIIC family phosphatase [Spirillospora albida]
MKPVKCVVWDLDDTVWSGILLEDHRVEPRPEVLAAVRRLDERGILQSVASRNDHDTAMARLRELELADYLLHPQINWNPKSNSIAAIARSLNIGVDALAFVDDQEFERDEVAFAHPGVLCADVADLDRLLDDPRLNPSHVTEESRSRRLKYLADNRREQDERSFAGTREEFLATLGMVFTIAPAGEADLRRAEELTVRTNQLNSTGVTYSLDELRRFAESPDHLLLVADLEDRYGSYGKIGLALVERGPVWTVKLLLMSCRVMSRGVGTVLLNHLMRLARADGARLRAEFRPTDRNRVMRVTYGFAGFREIETREDGTVILESDLETIQPVPAHLTLNVG